MNDWEIKKFLSVIISIQLAIWGLIGLDALNFQVPILRQFIGFIYLAFVPGILILRILKIHNLGNIEALLYTVGLSISAVMFIGFFMNMVYPIFGIFRPISLTLLIITISTFILFLCVLCYLNDKDFANHNFIDVSEMLSPPILLLCFIPFMAVFGSYLVNFHHANNLLMMMIAVIAIVALLIAFDKVIPASMYPMAIFLIALSLIYHNSLISMYINTDDLPIEYYFSNLVSNNNFWDYTIYNNYNAMLSVVMLPPILHQICDLELVWCFKILYPLLYSLIPLGIYFIYEQKTNNKIAFLASFYFVSISNFYSLPSSVGRQLIAEIFFVLLIMLLINTNILLIKRSVLAVIFAISLVVSHYGLSYLFMLSLFFVFLISFLTENPIIKKAWKKCCASMRKNEKIWVDGNSNTKNSIVSINFLLFFIVLVVTWYMYITSSSAFNEIISIGDKIANTLFTEFLSPESSRGAALLTREHVSLLHGVNKVLQLIPPSLITICMLTVLPKHKDMKFDQIYIKFSLYWLAICFSSIAIPYFAVMNPQRLYRISLFFLAPFAIMGGIITLQAITKFFSRFFSVNKSSEQSMKILYIFFIILLLFNTGFIFEIANDYPNSISLSQDNIKKTEYPELKALYYIKIIPEQDIFSAKWLSMEMKRDEKIYASVAIGDRALVGYGGLMPDSSRIRILSNKTEHTKAGSYIYLSKLNTIENIGIDLDPKLFCPIYFSMNDIYLLLIRENKIYANGGSNILWY